MSAVETALARLSGRVLSYDELAARIYAEVQESRRGAGVPMSVEDAMIAAIVLRHGAPLATRNVDDFVGLGVDLVDPWERK